MQRPRAIHPGRPKTCAYPVQQVGANCAACCKSNPKLYQEQVTSKMIEKVAARKKKQQDKIVSSPEEFCKNQVSSQMSNAAKQGFPVDWVEQVLQLHKNNLEALERVKILEID